MMMLIDYGRFLDEKRKRRKGMGKNDEGKREKERENREAVLFAVPSFTLYIWPITRLSSCGACCNFLMVEEC